jgi:hypothetical protein
MSHVLDEAGVHGVSGSSEFFGNWTQVLSSVPASLVQKYTYGFGRSGTKVQIPACQAAASFSATGRRYSVACLLRWYKSTNTDSVDLVQKYKYLLGRQQRVFRQLDAGTQ